MKTRFEKLLEPGRIGEVPTRNRILKTGSHLGFEEFADGYVLEKSFGFYEAVARGGVGLIVVGAADIDYPLGTVPNVGWRIDDDRYIDGFAKLTKTINRHGCRAFIQMFHMGPMHPTAVSGLQPVAASTLSKGECPRPQFEPARALTTSEVEDLVEKFASAAVRAWKAGFEGIELNSACNHLLNSFLSRAWNRREDGYGGPLENRARIVREIIEEVKRRNGRGFAVISLLNGAEVGLPDGITPAESAAFARLFREAGADAFHVRAEFYTAPRDPSLRESTHFPEVALYPEPPYPLGELVDGGGHGAGGWLPLAATIKRAVSAPVIAVGRLDPVLGERALRRGQADFVSFNRRLMADPELPRKVAQGRLDEIAPCTACLTCFDRVETGQTPRCRVNAALGREYEYALTAAPRKKRVLVVGGGPAGMEAARVAAQRGHAVTLLEREKRLGGALPLAAVVKGSEREDLLALGRYLAGQLEKNGVEVRLGVEVTKAVVEEARPEAVVVAVGGTHAELALPGVDRPHVVTGRDLHRKLKGFLGFFPPEWIERGTRYWLPLGKKVVIVGGGVHGCQTAEFLVKRGREVTVVDEGPEIGTGLIGTLLKPLLLQWLTEHGVRLLAGVELRGATERGLVVASAGTEEILPADTVVIALPLGPNGELASVLEGVVPEVHVIGDAREPNLIVDAVEDGAKVGRLL
ncbi:MAG: FAD-dependent oxidoreductase [Deltaproteobacteria bacterium]|nr:FAD-dependent oxidoreductase [Deltaproteobacteria bacterium]